MVPPPILVCWVKVLSLNSMKYACSLSKFPVVLLCCPPVIIHKHRGTSLMSSVFRLSTKPEGWLSGFYYLPQIGGVCPCGETAAPGLLKIGKLHRLRRGKHPYKLHLNLAKNKDIRDLCFFKKEMLTVPHMKTPGWICLQFSRTLDRCSDFADPA